MQFPIFTNLMKILFPERCYGCAQPGIALCSTCIGRIPYAADFPAHTHAVFDYGNHLVRRAIRDLKYHRRSEAAHALVLYALPLITEYLSDQLQSFSPDTIVLVPIPSYRSRKTARGFNQSRLIAEWMSALGARIADCLIKDTATLPQAKLNRKARMHNLSHTMSCNSRLDPKDIYIIVDDVITTGATCNEARRALKACGARKIISLALAHGYIRT